MITPPSSPNAPAPAWFVLSTVISPTSLVAWPQRPLTSTNQPTIGYHN